MATTTRSEPTRSDWRTCKRSESFLVQSQMNRLDNFDEDEREEMSSWTLYGQMLLQKEPGWFHEMFPLYPPDTDDSQWYRQRLLWIRYGRYYMGRMG